MTLVQTIPSLIYALQYTQDSIKTGDWDGDGRTDMIVDGNVYRANSLGQLAFYGSASAGGVTGDFDGDARTDFLAPTGTVSLSTGTGFATAGSISGLDADDRLTVADFNGDGFDDVFAANFTTALYLSKGNGSFSLAYTGTGFQDLWFSIFVGDWNNDGRADIAYRSGTSGVFAVATGNPSTTLRLSRRRRIGSTPRSSPARCSPSFRPRSMLGGLPCTALCDAIFAHPTMAEGFNALLASIPDANALLAARALARWENEGGRVRR